MPDLARFLLRHALIGFAIAIPFVALLLALDVAGLRRVILGSEMPVLAVLLLTGFIGLTFGSFQMGYAIWQTGKEGPALPPEKPRSDDDDRPLPR